jgi:hypothetical protein
MINEIVKTCLLVAVHNHLTFEFWTKSPENSFWIEQRFSKAAVNYYYIKSSWHTSGVSWQMFENLYVNTRGSSILGEVRHVWIWGVDSAAPV